jgi:hypothetical protein
MSDRTSRRRILQAIAGLPFLEAAQRLSAEIRTDALVTHEIAAGDLRVLFRDNIDSPKQLSGLDSLFHSAAPDFDAYDPADLGASAGLNFEHIISGHANPNNAFTPRKGPFPMTVLPDGRSVQLTRKREDDPWAMSSTLTYTVTPPHYVDMHFRCTPHDASLFGERGYAVLFFANYMHDVENLALHFRGKTGPDAEESWIAADAPPGHPDWNQGGTYRSLDASDLAYDAGHNFRLNSWSYDWPRFTQPFYYGRAARGMTLMMMFDRTQSDVDEVRFSLFKFKTKRHPRPAWDFQYVIRGIEAEREYGFRARLVWKPFVSAEDCQREYDQWRAESAGTETGP